MKYANGIDVAVGQRVLVIRQGIQSTGKEGIVTAVEETSVAVLLDGRLNALKFNPLSLRLIKEAEPKEVLVEVIIEPNEGDIMIYTHKDGNLLMRTYEGRGEFTETDTDILFDKGQVIPKINYIGFIPKGRVKFTKPNNNTYPFWCPMSKEETVLKTYTRDNGTCYLVDTNDVMYSYNWLVKGQISRSEMVKQQAPLGFDELLSTHRKKRAKTLRGRGLCYGVNWNLGGKLRFDEAEQAACHYAMRCFNAPDKRTEPHSAIQYITNKFYGGERGTDKKRTKVVDAYLTWVMNTSPWSQYIVTKDIDEAWDIGVLVNCNIPSNALMCVMYALRYPTEYYESRVHVWYDFVTKHNADPTVAYFLSETDEGVRDTKSHHQLLDTFHMSMENLADFILHKKGKINAAIYGKDGRYNYENVSIHHCSKEEPVCTALKELQRKFKGEVRVEQHPVLGEVHKEIPALEQMVEHLNEIAKGRA